MSRGAVLGVHRYVHLLPGLEPCWMHRILKLSHRTCLPVRIGASLFRFLVDVPQGSGLSFGIADFVRVAVELKNVFFHVDVESKFWHIVLLRYMDYIWCAVVTLRSNWSRDHAKCGYARLCGVAKVMRNETLQRTMDIWQLGCR